jgi:glycosyltransferase involved in cell wall biosynthesis
MVTKFLPLPDNSGGKQRSLAVARYLAGRTELVLCAYDDGTGDVAGLERLGIEVRSVPWNPNLAGTLRGVLATRSVSAGRFFSAALRSEVRRVAEHEPLGLLQVEYLQMAPLCAGVVATRRVLDLHNVESALVQTYAELRTPPSSLLYRAEAAALRALERKAVAQFDTLVVVSERERERLPATAPVVVCPNGRDPTGPLEPASTPTVAFVSTMGWAPNSDAARWLCREVWPEVLLRCPDARLLLVGRDPPPDVLAMASSSIEVTGTVPDVMPYLARARVAVAPLRAGGGTRLKILEALDAGRPVVSTRLAVDGLEDLVGQGVVVADEAPEMARALAELLADPGAAGELGYLGHRAVAAAHTWEESLASMVEVISG